MTKKTITREEYQQLLGLFVLAQRHRASLDEIVRAGAAIVGAPTETGSYFGHVSDFLYGGESGGADEMLRLMWVEVADGA